jgi:hypothetical protein
VRRLSSGLGLLPWQPRQICERAASFYTLIRSAKMNGLEPEAYLRGVLTRIVEHPVNAIDDLLPWNIGKPVALRAAARAAPVKQAKP